MKFKVKREFSELPVIELLDEKSIGRINNLMQLMGINTQYYKKPKGKSIKIIEKDKDFKWWDRLIRGKPGFDRGDYEPK